MEVDLNVKVRGKALVFAFCEEFFSNIGFLFYFLLNIFQINIFARIFAK